ncbi:MAG: hypothetical protein A2268_11715 [Candidatus Raymondbacteria bacterium RifOxyA12_full_50_37]|nr:MAG: hypothetical protein A2248_18930 [Candidatus Raymondbacteria bacterium RIFOXYA2_FULL_49_16]OGJ91823.1 MAG: hypothetical protein A2268_11715 [Candidatus Raymondbacteria bacterium RifOxyA12_full_50_37]OGJ92690.1 MAG: hypothetical protein A2350_04020 [Candidatus Raymondbacteria bacterium RifOxyB12_full_50_8]OGJ95417.1 MAG: hypothetical protein A2453_09150 [Candidatus Raymondbacteria bacterium RIFOXYC2_FULL_50_21]OGJ97847.1 MAG: hypothetical protein A2487_17650 [Candidatus Raymondbacteria b
MILALFALLLFSATHLEAANITDAAGGSRLIVVENRTFTRTIDVCHINSGTSEIVNGTVTFRISRFSNPAPNMPLMVGFHSWGASIDEVESNAGYEYEGNDPFLLITFEDGGDVPGPTYVEGNWYWGKIWRDSAGKRWSVPWFHNAVAEIINDIKYGRFSVADSCGWQGLTIDTNRIYAKGHSIGGTATFQFAVKHPEIFAAFHAHSGWTTYYGYDNIFFNHANGCCGCFCDMIGSMGSYPAIEYDPNTMIKGNADQAYLGIMEEEYAAGLYTDLGWYFGPDGSGGWNFRNPGFPTPYVFFTNGANDNPVAQGDNVQPSLELQRRGYTFYRHSGGHSDQNFMRYRRLRNFRKDQSYLAFTNRDYGINSLSQTGWFNDLDVHGWDHTTIKDSAGFYEVRLTGIGTADITLQRLQRLQHGAGSIYEVRLDGVPGDTVTADEYGLITIPHVSGGALLRLDCITCNPAVEIIQKSEKKPDEGMALLASPNPFNPSITISLKGGKINTKCHVSIYSLTGKQVLSKGLSTFNIHQSAIKWDAADQPSGVYVIKAQSGDRVLVKRVILVK